MTLRFLSLDNALRIHEDTVVHEGGSSGVRDWGLLESTVATPRAMFSGEYLHRGLAAMAATLLYHLCRNYPFVDGNKRTAAFGAVLLLALSGLPEGSQPPEEELECAVHPVAAGAMTKAALTECFQRWVPDEAQRQ